ncbi:hypothetical protein WDW86_15795 [Bdellovibrionota bacterium FG-2]
MIELLNYAEREKLKQYNDPYLAAYARYHRFLESLYGELEVIRAADFTPTFVEYQDWLNRFPGWSCGHLKQNHCAWKPEYLAMERPMNVLYEQEAAKHASQGKRKPKPAASQSRNQDGP